MKILLVEDDIDLNETVKEYLEKFYEIDPVFDGEEAVKKAYENRYDLMILDVKLPEKDGFEVAREIRKFSDVPIVFLTSLNSEKDVETGFLSGGDDYIKKPFSLKELKLRIDAILNRLYGGKEVDLGDGFVFDVVNMELKKNGETIHLKPKIAELLKLFIKNKNRVITKEEIFDNLYSYDEEPNEASLRTFITTLRNILGKDKIETIKGVGYKFVG
jgi:DNA-binding response OmpR family regulator